MRNIFYKGVAIIGLTLFLLTGCAVNETRVALDEVKKIEMKLVKTRETDNGAVYEIEVKNNSKYNIKQNNIYFSYESPLPDGMGFRSNPFKVEVQGNKLDIKPEEKIIVTATIPKDNVLDAKKVDIKAPRIDMQGFFEKVDEKNQFNSTQPLK
jgi:uncharacterized protein YcfL